MSDSPMRDISDWSTLPKDLYITGVKSDGIVFNVNMSNVPMAIGPEVRYSLSSPKIDHKMATDISREACERLADMAARFHDVVGVPELILALRAVLDRAEANTAAAVEAMREACAAAGLDAALENLDPYAVQAAIRAIPSPAPMTVAQAARVPEVAALIDAAKALRVRYDVMGCGDGIEAVAIDRALATITEPKP